MTSPEKGIEPVAITDDPMNPTLFPVLLHERFLSHFRDDDSTNDLDAIRKEKATR